MSRVYTIKSIHEVYADTEFDSRLNAEYAKFFDAHKIPWTFEPAPFRLPCRPKQNYWPDFKLRGIGYAEVKFSEFEEIEYSLCAELAIRTGNRVLMLAGPPRLGPFNCFRYDRRERDAFLEEWRF